MPTTKDKREASNVFLVLFFKKDREEKVHSSFTKPRTWNMAIFANFTKCGKLEIRALLHAKDGHNFVREFSICLGNISHASSALWTMVI